MLKLTTAAQMREMDRRTIEEFGVPSIVLMENAALRVVDVIAERFGPLKGKRIAVVCGKGNNGGDGLAIARHLATRFGAVVTVHLAADPAGYKGDAAVNYALAQSFGLDIDTSGSPRIGGRGADLIIDALLGTGIKGGVEGKFAETIEAMNASYVPIVSVDVPSGLDADTGEVNSACVKATLTVTFALPKIGLMVYPGAEYVGELIIANIGMPQAVMAAEDVKVMATEASDIAKWLPARVNGRDSNKGKFGHVTVFAGSAGFAGAPTLSAEAAARAGSGLVTLAVPLGIQNALMSGVSPVIMTKGLPETADGTLSQSAVESALKLAGKGTVAALGPGLGGADNEDTRAFVREFVSRCPVPLVIDADALNCLSSEPDRGASIVKSRSAATVLTPHPGEMGRLLGTDTKAVQSDRRAAVEQAAQDYGCVVLLKGARTLIAAPDGRLAVNTTSNPGMATGGAGDVLTGLLAALLGSDIAAWEAAAGAAYLHGLAGDLRAKEQGGPAGLIATDLIDYLPAAIAHCHAEAAHL
ncbi:MAG: NAD(P)H-hydrate dehydratase [Janthinobacterium lividum]